MIPAAISPGRIGPGLIEASTNGAVTTGVAPDLPGESARASLKHARNESGLKVRHRDLPGESARASLKPMYSEVGVVAAAVSPGRIGPGLIEACHEQMPAASSTRDLPGESARASLKRDEADSRASVLPYLPGESARASLKPVRYRASLARHGESPGRIGPGLIEAPCGRFIDWAGMRVISRANRPGPH